MILIYLYLKHQNIRETKKPINIQPNPFLLFLLLFISFSVTYLFSFQLPLTLNLMKLCQFEEFVTILLTFSLQSISTSLPNACLSTYK